MNDVIYWRAKMRESHYALRTAVLNAFPVGTQVRYMIGYNEQTVTVVRHGNGDRILVRSKANKQYWIDASRITEQLSSDHE